jgi:hypothetical protein
MFKQLKSQSIFTGFLFLMTSFFTYAGSLDSFCPQGKFQAGNIVNMKNKGIDLSIMSRETANSLHQHLRSMDEIPYRYTVDGCDVRAYLGSIELKEKYNINTFRINVETYPNFIMTTPYTLEGWVDFGRHSVAAVCVFDENQNKTVPYVLDVAFFDQATAHDKWLSTLLEGNDQDVEKSISSMYSLSPEGNKRSREFTSRDRQCAEQVRSRFMREQEKIDRGQLPIGVGRGKEVIRLDLCL